MARPEVFENIEEAYDWVLQMGGHLAQRFDGVFDRAYINDIEYKLVIAHRPIFQPGYSWLPKGKYKA
jgi:hypothetical protein